MKWKYRCMRGPGRPRAASTARTRRQDFSFWAAVHFPDAPTENTTEFSVLSIGIICRYIHGRWTWTEPAAVRTKQRRLN